MTKTKFAFLLVLAIPLSLIVPVAITNFQEKQQAECVNTKTIETAEISADKELPACYVNNSLAARERWLKGEDGYVMIHHVRRAGGTTLCGIFLEDEQHPLLRTNCRLAASDVVGHSPIDGYSLWRIHNLSVLEKEMERQGTKVVAIEGYELPEWFLSDPARATRWTIVTSMRDPIDRLVSISRVKCPENPQECWSKKLEGQYPLNNVMTRMFAGGGTLGGLGDPLRTVTEDDLATAIRLLETQYQIIVITEWLLEMTPVFKYWLGN